MLPGAPEQAHVAWPNRWSRLLGDKAYGLLVAHLAGLPVPAAQVFPRGTAPFSFGRQTGIAEPWIRTCPVEQVPGRFTTRRGWMDPYGLMQREDPDGTAIASILAQRGVDAKLLRRADLAAGRGGAGGRRLRLRRPVHGGRARAGGACPAGIVADVRALYAQAHAALGPVRFEWVHDGKQAWVVQLHRGASVTQGRVIYPGDAPRWHRFPVEGGIAPLRDLIGTVSGTGEGIVLVGRVGVTSHFGDLLRRARIPSRIEEPEE